MQALLVQGSRQPGRGGYPDINIGERLSAGWPDLAEHSHHDYVPTGRLRLHLTQGDRKTGDTFEDTATTRLENKTEPSSNGSPPPASAKSNIKPRSDSESRTPRPGAASNSASASSVRPMTSGNRRYRPRRTPGPATRSSPHSSAPSIRPRRATTRDRSPMGPGPPRRHRPGIDPSQRRTTRLDTPRARPRRTVQPTRTQALVLTRGCPYTNLRRKPPTNATVDLCRPTRPSPSFLQAQRVIGSARSRVRDQSIRGFVSCRPGNPTRNKSPFRAGRTAAPNTSKRRDAHPASWNIALGVRPRTFVQNRSSEAC